MQAGILSSLKPFLKLSNFSQKYTFRNNYVDEIHKELDAVQTYTQESSIFQLEAFGYKQQNQLWLTSGENNVL